MPLKNEGIDMDEFQRSELKKNLTVRSNQRIMRRHERLLEDIKDLVKTANGRRLLYWMMDNSGVFGATFVEGMPDKSSFNQGRASVGRQLLNAILESSQEAFFQMQREKASERAQDMAEDNRIIQEVRDNG